jgi:hypothetical protein
MLMAKLLLPSSSALRAAARSDGDEANTEAVHPSFLCATTTDASSAAAARAPPVDRILLVAAVPDLDINKRRRMGSGD